MRMTKPSCLCRTNVTLSPVTQALRTDGFIYRIALFFKIHGSTNRQSPNRNALLRSWAASAAGCRADLVRADLTGAELEGAGMEGAKLEGAVLAGARLREAGARCCAPERG